jgi:hypothetical protein
MYGANYVLAFPLKLSPIFFEFDASAYIKLLILFMILDLSKYVQGIHLQL